jgi:hypothetical protein
MENYLPTPIEFINTKDFNTDGELLQGLFDEYNKLDPTANKNKFAKNITSVVGFPKVVILGNITKNKRFYFCLLLILFLKRTTSTSSKVFKNKI